MATTIPPTVRTRTFHQAHPIAPQRVFRQAHLRPRPESSAARVGFALVLTLLAGAWSLPQLPSAVGAVLPSMPPAERADVASAAREHAPSLTGAAGAMLASVRLPADEGTARSAPPSSPDRATTSTPPAGPASGVRSSGSASGAAASASAGSAAAGAISAGSVATRSAASRVRASMAQPAAPARAVASARAVAQAGTAATSPARIVLPPAGSRSTRPVAAFLGDSYTTGYVGAGIGSAGWPAIVSAALGLRAANDAVAGTGFVNPGWTGQPVSTRVGAVIRARPRVVFVAAGHNDRRFSASASAAAADLVLRELRAALPNSVIVVIAPIWQDGRPPASLRALRDHLRVAAAKVGAVFIDPLIDPWFGGTAHRLIGPDGIHPTDAGHRRIADLVLRALAARPGILAGLRVP